MRTFHSFCHWLSQTMEHYHEQLVNAGYVGSQLDDYYQEELDRLCTAYTHGRKPRKATHLP